MSAERVAYLDSSALVKLVLEEPESDALVAHLRRRPVCVTCALARVEVPRAVRRHGPEALARADDVLRGVAMLALDDALLDAAAALDGEHLRSLDAIHVAAARELGEDLHELVTYDVRMAAAAAAHGCAVAAPS